MMKKNSGFTLIEVLISVAILGLVATGSLRLMMMSSRGLADVQGLRDMLNFARKTQLEFMTQESKPSSGAEDNFRWDMIEKSWPILSDKWDITYREITIETDRNRIVLYMPVR